MPNTSTVAKPTMESGLMSLPLDILQMILDETVIALETKKALRLRLVNKLLATEILHKVCQPGGIIVTREDTFKSRWKLLSMSKVFHVGLLLSRLDLGYAVQIHYLSSILEAEDLLMGQYPDQTREQRNKFRYALCAAEPWRFNNVTLRDIEPIFPQEKPRVSTSPLSDALSAAAFIGDIRLVQKLLLEGADVNFDNGYLKPPLQQAASRGHNDILLLLLSKGADITTGYWKPRDSRNCGALYSASLYGHETTVELLLDRKDYLTSELCTSEDIVFPAIEGGHLNLIRKMFQKSSILTYVKNNPRPGLFMLRNAVYYGHEHIARWLLENGVDVTKNNHAISWGMSRTPLEIAAQHGRLHIVRLLLEHDSNRHVPALAYAAQNGHVEVAKLLLDTVSEDVNIGLMLHGERPFNKRKRHETPLCLAVFHGEVRMVRFLLGRGIKQDFQVSLAADRGEEEILQLLLEAEIRLGIDKDYTKLLTWLTEREDVPKRISNLISNLILELSPTTRAAAIVAPSDSAE